MAKKRDIKAIAVAIMESQGIRHEDWLESKYQEFMFQNALTIQNALKGAGTDTKREASDAPADEEAAAPGSGSADIKAGSGSYPNHY